MTSKLAHAVVAIAVTAAPALALPDNVGTYRPGRTMFFEDVNGNRRWDGAANGDHVYMYVQWQWWPLDGRPVVGDWDGDGYDQIGMMAPNPPYGYSCYSLDTDNDNKTFGDGRDRSLCFGTTNDLPFTGDWDGDGKDELGTFRPATARMLLHDLWGQTLRVTVFGQPGDLPVAGDWNGDGVDEVGVLRPGNGRFILDANGNGVQDAGDPVHQFGQQGDVPIAGDWDDDGVDEIGVFRPGNQRFYLDANGNGVFDAGDLQGGFGDPTDHPIAGTWRP